MTTIPTLYEWAGDIKTFEKLFTSFYEKVLKILQNIHCVGSCEAQA